MCNIKKSHKVTCSKFFIFSSCKGGTSSGYRKFIEEKGIVDETYNKNLVTLFRVQGTSPDNMQAIQVDQVSFNDSDFIHSGALFIISYL